MAVRLKLAALGHTMERGKVVQWYVDEGGVVAEGAPLFAVETDKDAAHDDAPPPVPLHRSRREIRVVRFGGVELDPTGLRPGQGDVQRSGPLRMAEPREEVSEALGDRPFEPFRQRGEPFGVRLAAEVGQNRRHVVEPARCARELLDAGAALSRAVGLCRVIDLPIDPGEIRGGGSLQGVAEGLRG